MNAIGKLMLYVVWGVIIIVLFTGILKVSEEWKTSNYLSSRKSSFRANSTKPTQALGGLQPTQQNFAPESGELEFPEPKFGQLFQPPEGAEVYHESVIGPHGYYVVRTKHMNLIYVLLVEDIVIVVEPGWRLAIRALTEGENIDIYWYATYSVSQKQMDNSINVGSSVGNHNLPAGVLAFSPDNFDRTLLTTPKYNCYPEGIECWFGEKYFDILPYP